MHTFRSIGLTAALFVSLVATAHGQGQWGDLKGTFQLIGKAPAPAKIPAPGCPAGVELVDESLLVGAKGGIENVVVWLLPDKGVKVSVHPSYDKLLKTAVEFDNAKCRFAPHIAVAHTDQKIVFGNKDNFGHNVNAMALKNKPFNELIPGNGSISKVMTEVESLPIGCSCNIHKWMNGHLVVKDHPYVAVTDKDGSFTMANLPTGKWTFRAWHERPGYVKKVTLAGKESEWTQGKFPVTIQDKKTVDLGNVGVELKVFTK
jgi:plastocyanin